MFAVKQTFVLRDTFIMNFFFGILKIRPFALSKYLNIILKHFKKSFNVLLHSLSEIQVRIKKKHLGGSSMYAECRLIGLC